MTGTITQSAIKGHYRSGIDELGPDFFAPCLAASKVYRRASGYFSSGALVTWAEGLLRLGQGKELAIRLIASPELPAGDRAILQNLDDAKELARDQAIMVEDILTDIERMCGGSDDAAARASVFAWLLAHGRLQIRFAFPDHIDDAAMFHEKMPHQREHHVARFSPVTPPAPPSVLPPGVGRRFSDRSVEEPHRPHDPPPLRRLLQPLDYRGFR